MFQTNNVTSNKPRKCFTLINQRYIKWNINIGIPEATLESNEKKQLYEWIIKLAWGVSLKEEKIIFDLEKLTKEPDFHQEDIGVFPECDAFLLSVEKSNVYRGGPPTGVPRDASETTPRR